MLDHKPAQAVDEALYKAWLAVGADLCGLKWDDFINAIKAAQPVAAQPETIAIKNREQWADEVMTAANKFAGAHFSQVQAIMYPSEYKSDVAEQQAHLAKEELRALLLEVPEPELTTCRHCGFRVKLNEAASPEYKDEDPFRIEKLAMKFCDQYNMNVDDLRRSLVVTAFCVGARVNASPEYKGE
tara:strand:- start:4218 stop:4772 length:555 start_codon:yes stop_codon:yes gene_type:complete